MDLKTPRRLAASILKVGEDRIWLDPEDAEAISSAVTREDIRRLIKNGAIQAKPVRGVSRYRARKLRLQRMKGRRRGPGKRSGKRGARLPKKRRWISTIRAIRRRLRELREAGEIDSRRYRKLYLMAKGGAFKSKAHLETVVKEYRR
jgi:large subunit ribosomal protein L19e